MESRDRQSKKDFRQSPAEITKVKKFFANGEQKLQKSKVNRRRKIEITKIKKVFANGE